MKLTVVETMVNRLNGKLAEQKSLFRLHLSNDITGKTRRYRLDRLRPDGQKIFKELDQKFLCSGAPKAMIAYLNGFSDALNIND